MIYIHTFCVESEYQIFFLNYYFEKINLIKHLNNLLQSRQYLPKIMKKYKILYNLDSSPESEGNR